MVKKFWNEFALKMNSAAKFLVILLICVNSGSLNSLPTPSKLSPVIFVPGDGGSQLDAKLNKSSAVHYICQKHTDNWFNIWLNKELLVPLVIDCWIDNVKLYYDNLTRTTVNTPGVETRVPGWGDPDVVEWIDPSHASVGAYFKDIGNALVAAGYVRKVSMRGAPYDFRKAPNENKKWFIDMKTLVEETFAMNNNSRITFISHSMGSPMTLTFLHMQSSSWKQKYISRVISLAGAWGGSIKAIKVFAIGDDLGSFALSGKTLRPEQITSPSLAWLLPSPLFWKPNEIFAETPTRVYNMGQLEEYFNDIDYMTGWEMRKDTLRYSTDFRAPEVEIHCIYGTQVPTVEKLLYSKSIISTETPKLMTGDGDGTVNGRSLQACMQWTKLQKQGIYPLNLSNVDHMQILSDKRVINYIVDILKKHDS